MTTTDTRKPKHTAHLRIPGTEKTLCGRAPKDPADCRWMNPMKTCLVCRRAAHKLGELMTPIFEAQEDGSAKRVGLEGDVALGAHFPTDEPCPDGDDCQHTAHVSFTALKVLELPDAPDAGTTKEVTPNPEIL